MPILTQTDIATTKLETLGLKDLTSYTTQQKKNFWASVNKEYLALFPKQTT